MAEQSKTARVAIYVRVSTLQQADKDSLPMQRQDLIAYAKLMLNTDDYVIFEDAGYSGKNTDRPKYQEMMSQIRSGVFTHLLVWKIDRISRNLLDFASMYAELKNLGVIFVSRNEQFDTGTAMGEAMLKIILVFAELERNMTSERVLATMISRANNGLWNGGAVPYGYDYDPDTKTFSINEAEAHVVRMIHDMYEKDRSLIRIARVLNESGYRSRSGNYWTYPTLMIILRNGFYDGDYYYNVTKDGSRQKIRDKSEWVIFRDHHPPIIDREQKERILSVLGYASRDVKKQSSRSRYCHVFGGLLICGNCGKPLTFCRTNPTKDGWRGTRYQCVNRRTHKSLCSGRDTSDPVLGEFVFNYILNTLNAQRNFASIRSPEDLQTALLTGNAFAHIVSIEPDGLNELYDVLKAGGVSGEIYGKSAGVQSGIQDSGAERAKLQVEKQRLERAIERLNSLYLYSDDAMPEREYVIQKLKLTEALEEVTNQIDFVSSAERQQSVTDEAFIQKASEFIIAQNLTDRAYVSYKRLAMTVDENALHSFVSSVIDNIIILDGKVKTIVFRNGLAHTFIFREQVKK